MVDPPHCLPTLRLAAWDAIPDLCHGFFGRRGGISRGAFAELNLSSRVGDIPEAVHENWRRVAAAAPGLQVAHMQQVHGTRVVTVDGANLDAGEADGAVTSAPATALGVLTADCVPILLVAPRHHVVGAVHAGWRGTLAGVVQDAVAHIEQAFGTPAAEIQAALGPSIGGCCYEVDRAIADAIERQWGPMPAAVRKDRAAKAMIDLRNINTAILERCGLRRAAIFSIGPCTRCASAEYFSHRAAHGPTGRQWSYIGWQA